MYHSIETRENRNPNSITAQTIAMSERKRDEDGDLTKSQLRWQMYERIAQGNALAEVEDKAQRRWRN